MADAETIGQAQTKSWVSLPSLIAVCVMLAFASVMALIFFEPNAINKHRYILPVLIGLVAFPTMILSIIFCAWVMSKLSLANGNFAFGLPQGTIRAVIAVGFIVLVLIFGVFVMTEAGTTSRLFFESEPIKQQDAGEPVQVTVGKRLADLRSQFGDDYIYETEITESGGKISAVIKVFQPVDNSSIVQLSQQILTMLATALTAIVGFYFGSRSTSDARESGEQAKQVQEAAEKKLEVGATVGKVGSIVQSLKQRLDELSQNLPDGDLGEAVDSKIEKLEEFLDAQSTSAGKAMTALTLSHEAIAEIRKAHDAVFKSLAHLETIKKVVDSVRVGDDETWKTLADLAIPSDPN